MDEILKLFCTEESTNKCRYLSKSCSKFIRYRWALFKGVRKNNIVKIAQRIELHSPYKNNISRYSNYQD